MHSALCRTSRTQGGRGKIIITSRTHTRRPSALPVQRTTIASAIDKLLLIGCLIIYYRFGMAQVLVCFYVPVYCFTRFVGHCQMHAEQQLTSESVESGVDVE